MGTLKLRRPNPCVAIRELAYRTVECYLRQTPRTCVFQNPTNQESKQEFNPGTRWDLGRANERTVRVRLQIKRGKGEESQRLRGRRGTCWAPAVNLFFPNYVAEDFRKGKAELSSGKNRRTRKHVPRRMERCWRALRFAPTLSALGRSLASDWFFLWIQWWDISSGPTQ
jgi:hypothetical protein